MFRKVLTMNRNRLKKLRFIQYWQCVDAGQQYLLKHRENFLMIASELGKSLETIRSDIASTRKPGTCSQNFMNELTKPRKTKLSDLNKQGLSTMRKQKQADRAAIDQYWRDLENIDRMDPQEMIKSAQRAGRTGEDMARDLRTLKRIKAS
jgi:hypothetical protein